MNMFLINKYLLVFIAFSLISTLICSDDKSFETKQVDKDVYITSNLPNEYTLDMPDTLNNQRELTNTLSAKEYQVSIRSNPTNSSNALGQIVSNLQQTIVDEEMEIEYIMADLFYTDVKQYFEKYPDAEFLAQGTLSGIKCTDKIRNRLENVYSKFLSEEDAVKKIEIQKRCILNKDMVNPNFYLNYEESREFKNILDYWWDKDVSDEDEVLYATSIAWSNSKVRITFNGFYDDDKGNNGNWDFRFYYNLNTKVLNVFDQDKGNELVNSVSVSFDYSSNVTLEKCSYGDNCLRIDYNFVNYKQAVNNSTCSGVEDSRLHLEGIVSDAAGFIDYTGISTCNNTAHSSWKYRKSLNSDGSEDEKWTYSNNKWFDANDNEVSKFTDSYDQLVATPSKLSTLHIVDSAFTSDGSFEYILTDKDIALSDDNEASVENSIIAYGYYFRSGEFLFHYNSYLGLKDDLSNYKVLKEEVGNYNEEISASLSAE